MFQDHFCFSISYQPSRISSLVRSVRRKPPPKEKFNWSLNTEKLHLCVARILISMFIAMTWHRSMTLRLLGSIAMRKSELKARRGKISFVEVIWLLVASSAISDFNTWFSIHRSSVYSSEPTLKLLREKHLISSSQFHPRRIFLNFFGFKPTQLSRSWISSSWNRQETWKFSTVFRR